MLYDLSFLEPGEPWPPESEAERIKKMRDHRLLFESRAEEVYGHWVRHVRNGIEEETSHSLGFWRRLSMLWPSLIVGEAPKYTAGEPDSEEQGYLEDLLGRNAFGAVCSEVLIDQSRHGDGLFKVRLEDGQAVIESQSPEQWFPVVSESNIRRIRYHVLAWTAERSEGRRIPLTDIPRGGARLVKYLRVEIHEAGRIEHRVYRLKEDSTIETRIDGAEFEENWPGDVEESGASYPLVIHSPGRRTSEALFGMDDYTPIDSAMEYILDMIAQRQVTIYKHNDPSISGPEITLDTDAAGNPVYAGGSRYFTIDSDATVRPEYMVWDAKMEASFQQEDRLWQGVYRDSETSPTIFSFSETGHAESGTSLKLRCISSLKKAEDLVELFEPAVLRTFEVAAQLEGRELTGVTVEWRDGLPEDEGEQSQISERDVSTGVRSRKSEMMRRFGYTDAKADSELEQMDLEGGHEDPLAQLLNGASQGGGRIGRTVPPQTNGPQA